MIEKHCTKCGDLKPLSGFYKHRLTKDGYSYHCKECNKTRSRAWSKTASGIYSTIRGQAKFFNKGEVEITKDEFVAWYENEPKICHYCGILESDLHEFGDAFNNKNRRLEIDRKDNNKGYTKSNCHIILWSINCLKGEMTMEEFKKFIKSMKEGMDESSLRLRDKE